MLALITGRAHAGLAEAAAWACNFDEAGDNCPIPQGNDGLDEAMADMAADGAVGEASARIIVDVETGFVHRLHARAMASSSNRAASAFGTARASVTDDVEMFEHVAQTHLTVANIVVLATVHGTLSRGEPGEASVGAVLDSPAKKTSETSYFGNVPDPSFHEEIRSGQQPPAQATATINRRLGIELIHFFGISVPIELELGVFAAAGGAGSSSEADFRGTMMIESFNFYDSQGNFVDGLGVRGASGANYPVNAVVLPLVPEPSSLALISCSMGSIALAHRRRRSAASSR